MYWSVPHQEEACHRLLAEGVPVVGVGQGARPGDADDEEVVADAAARVATRANPGECREVKPLK